MENNPDWDQYQDWSSTMMRPLPGRKQWQKMIQLPRANQDPVSSLWSDKYQNLDPEQVEDWEKVQKKPGQDWGQWKFY